MSYMKQTKFLIVFLMCEILVYQTHISAMYAKAKKNVYYVNEILGNDNNPGTQKLPFKSIDKINTLPLKEGDIVLFAGGQIYSGTIRFTALLGTKENPVTISSYGNQRATIYGKDSFAIKISDSKHIIIKNINAKGKGRLSGNCTTGIDLQNTSYGFIDSVDVSGFLNDGIGIWDCENISITHAYSHDNGSGGIHVDSRFMGKKLVKKLYIAHCIAENNPGNQYILDNHSGNGILLGNVTNAIVEYCEAMNNGWAMPRNGNGPVGIWVYESDSIQIQYCYSHDNKTSPFGSDGGGFDFDGGTTNSIFQYNISANNEGAGFGIFQYKGAGKWNNNIVRYNVSIDDGIKNSHAGIFVWCDPSASNSIKNCTIYKNLIINKHGHTVSFSPEKYEGVAFTENIFLLTGEDKESHIDGSFTSATFNGNQYWSKYAELNNLPQPIVNIDSSAIYSNPQVITPTTISVEKIKEIINSLIIK